MLKLCYKDFLAGRWFWLLALALYGLNWMFAFRQSLGIMLLTILLVGGCLAITFFQDQLSKTEILYGSLPLTRATLVRGRYLLAGLLALAALAFSFVYGTCLKAVFGLGDLGISLKALASVEGLAGYALALAFLTSLYFPLHYRLGAGKAVLAFFLCLLVLAVVVPGLGEIGLIPASLARRVTAPDFLKDIGLGLVGLLGQIREALGTAVFLASAAGLASTMIAVSVRLSIRLYQKADI